jgi:hypothetical protein
MDYGGYRYPSQIGIVASTAFVSTDSHGANAPTVWFFLVCRTRVLLFGGNHRRYTKAFAAVDGDARAGYH